MLFVVLFGGLVRISSAPLQELLLFIVFNRLLPAHTPRLAQHGTTPLFSSADELQNAIHVEVALACLQLCQKLRSGEKWEPNRLAMNAV